MLKNGIAERKVRSSLVPEWVEFEVSSYPFDNGKMGNFYQLASY